MEGWQPRDVLRRDRHPVRAAVAQHPDARHARSSIPGTVLFEGTNVSEGRGTTKPFELLGAPWVDAERFADGDERARAAGRALPPGGLRADVPQARADQLRRLPDPRARSRDVPAGRSRRRAASPRSARPIPIASAGAIRRTSTSTRLLPIDILAGSSELREQIEARRAGARHRAIVGAGHRRLRRAPETVPSLLTIGYNCGTPLEGV